MRTTSSGITCIPVRTHVSSISGTDRSDAACGCCSVDGRREWDVADLRRGRLPMIDSIRSSITLRSGLIRRKLLLHCDRMTLIIKRVFIYGKHPRTPVDPEI